MCLNANRSYNKRETHDCVQQRERMLQSALTMMTTMTMMTTTTMMTMSPLPTNTLPSNKNNNHSDALRHVELPTPRQLHHRRHEGPQELPAHRASRRNQRHGQPEALAQTSARLRHLHSPLQTSDQGLAALHLPLNPGARGLEPLQAKKKRRLPHQASTQLRKQREMALVVCTHIDQSTGTEHNHNQNSARVH